MQADDQPGRACAQPPNRLRAYGAFDGARPCPGHDFRWHRPRPLPRFRDVMMMKEGCNPRPLIVWRKSVLMLITVSMNTVGVSMRRSGTPREIVTLSNEKGEHFTMKRERMPEASYGRPFVTVFPDALIAHAADARLPRSFFPVLVWCWKNLDFKGWKFLNQREVAAELKCSMGSVNIALGLLRDRGIIERTGAGPRQAWRLTPETSWKGTAGGYRAEVRERARPAFTVVDGGAE
jgi:hypothetical protein